jgi:hypothetical protein
MNTHNLKDHNLEDLASRLLSGDLSVAQFVAQLRGPAIADLGETQLDLDRPRRCGFPEVVYAEGKTTAVMERIFQTLTDHGLDVLATRMSPEQADELKPKFSRGRYNPTGRTFRIPPVTGQPDQPPAAGKGRAVGNAQQLRIERDGGQYRRGLQRRIRRRADRTQRCPGTRGEELALTMEFHLQIHNKSLSKNQARFRFRNGSSRL